MSDINEITTALTKFRDDRNWKQFHTPKDLAIGVSTEAAELLELFLWKKDNEINRDRLKEELADVLGYCFLLAESQNLDIKEIMFDKIALNAKKYPIDKASGTAKKYTEL